MGNLWLKIKIWTKISIAGLIALYLLIFILKNGGENARFWWWFGREYQGPMLYLIVFAFLIGGLVAILATTTFRTMRQIKELRARNRSEKLEREISDMKTKAAMLQTRPVPGASATPPAEISPPHEPSEPDTAP
jgi:uncharacterized integral membrane protein